MKVDPEVRSKLVHMLYSAMPQVVSSTGGVVLLSSVVWWRSGAFWMMPLTAGAAVLMIVRLSLLIAYRRRNRATPAAPEAAIRWELRYGMSSMVMATIVALVLVTAFAVDDSGIKLLAAGVSIGICGGQSTARVTCRPWIPIASGSVILVALTSCAWLWKDPAAPVFAFFSLLYLYTYIEACRHSGRTILGRLIAENELAGLVRRDALTGLGNRTGFEEALARALSAAGRTGTAVSLLALDLDGFKAVNDNLGHPAGDAVLREVAERLRTLARRSDYLARLGGDEFAIVVSDAHDREALAAYARWLIESLSEPYELSEGSARIGVSIGIGSADPAGSADSSALLARADTALYTVKRAAKNDVAFAA